tara:strand:- start:962 stop:1648 length:687 start_codon:yes stop_codon:yes gene_type:complete
MLRDEWFYPMAAHDLRFLQIQVNMEQAKDMPAATLMNTLSSIEFVSTVSTTGDASEYILCLKYNDLAALEEFEKNEAFELSGIIEQKEGMVLTKAYANGPVAMLVHDNPEIWLQTPTQVTSSHGLFMTVHGTTKGLKRFRDDISELLPPSIKIRISKDLKADWIAAPQLPNRRKEVMELAVRLGYYSTPRRCTQRDLAEALGVRQGTIAEHLQSAESTIIQSWADQAK